MGTKACLAQGTDPAKAHTLFYAIDGTKNTVTTKQNRAVELQRRKKNVQYLAFRQMPRCSVRFFWNQRISNGNFFKHLHM